MSGIHLPLEGAAASLRLFPTRGNARQKWIYAVGLPDGVTRIGWTKSPRAAAMREWREHPEHIAWAHLFPVFRDFTRGRRVFELAITLCASTGERIEQKNLFLGLSKQVAIGCVRAALRANP